MKAGETMELQKALQAIRTKELQSIYLVIGSEMFLRPFWSVFPLGKMI